MPHNATIQRNTIQLYNSCFVVVRTGRDAKVSREVRSHREAANLPHEEFVGRSAMQNHLRLDGLAGEGLSLSLKTLVGKRILSTLPLILSTLFLSRYFPVSSCHRGYKFISS